MTTPPIRTQLEIDQEEARVETMLAVLSGAAHAHRTSDPPMPRCAGIMDDIAARLRRDLAAQEVTR